MGGFFLEGSRVDGFMMPTDEKTCFDSFYKGGQTFEPKHYLVFESTGGEKEVEEVALYYPVILWIVKSRFHGWRKFFFHGWRNFFFTGEFEVNQRILARYARIGVLRGPKGNRAPFYSDINDTMFVIRYYVIFGQSMKSILFT